ncbi:MAG TPA: group 1 truncated hemoglobin [Pseudomonadota bacterium]|nr:group 1 truncated hemoglobin [Pseudomonadota bacterium]
MMQSLYDQLGGAPAISAVVESFYRKMLSDDRVSRFFDGVDMDRQMAKQTAFITMVTGGPNHYTGRDMRTGHAHLVSRGLADLHVDVVVQHLAATLAEFGVSEENIGKVRAVCESVRDDVLGRHKPHQ